MKSTTAAISRRRPRAITAGTWLSYVRRPAGACIVLGSATPSLESRYNAQRGKYGLLELPGRIESRPHACSRAGGHARGVPGYAAPEATFSRRLLEEIALRLERTRAVHRAAEPPRSFPASWRAGPAASACSARTARSPLTYHKRDRRLLCHYCNYAERVPSTCPRCQSEHIYFLGVGSERVEEELHREFPTARIARLDRDTVTGKREYESVLAGFREGCFDILVGTQMIAQGA